MKNHLKLTVWKVSDFDTVVSDNEHLEVMGVTTRGG